jgi:hypothetical protein
VPPAKKPAAKRATKSTAAKKAAPRASSVKKYIRNLRYTPVTCRVSPERRIELRPRGMRGDMAQLSKQEFSDSRIQANIGLIFEALTQVEAQKVWDDQLTNQQSHHPAMDALRNDKGELFDNKNIVVKEETFNDQGVVVAELNDGQMVIDRGLGIQRFNGVGTQDNPIPVPADVDPDQQADWIARQNTEGPAAGLGNMEVTIETPQKGA